MAPAPTTVSFSCELCQTRLTAQVADVGKKLKCPDCGRPNRIPPPPAPAAPRVPGAMSGDQYELWGADDSPTPAELAARTPTLHPVFCQLCQTLMYATDRQVGTKLKCPDCGALTVAKAREAKKPRGSVLSPDGEEYQVDEAEAPPPRPMIVPLEVREAEHRAAARDRMGIVETPTADQRPEKRLPRSSSGPRRPAVPLVQGVLPMLLSAEVTLRWIALSAMLTLILWLLVSVLFAMGNQALYLLPFFAGGCILSAAWVMSAAPFWLAMVTQSSEGADELHDPPSWMSFDVAEAAFLILAAMIAAVPAWLATKGAGTLPTEAALAIGAGVWLVCFPFGMLSALEQGSAFAIVSPRLASSLVRCAGPWLLFLLESALLAAGAGYLGWKLFASSQIAFFLVTPWLAVGAVMIYMRLMGRLAWWIADIMPAPKEVATE